MKKLPLSLMLLILASCGKEEKKESLYPESARKERQTPEQLGKEIFEGKGNCIACHQPQQKIIGPSIHDIAKTYKDKNADIIAFLKGDSDPLIDPEQYEVMKTNFVITKAMSEEELKALKAYIYSYLK